MEVLAFLSHANFCHSLNDLLIVSLNHFSVFQRIGMTGFEPATPRSQSECSDQTELHSVKMVVFYWSLPNQHRSPHEESTETSVTKSHNSPSVLGLHQLLALENPFISGR